ncbi:hypothetical protein [Helicobacter sp. NHP22-001]|uniref:hypothetical protein n=1 Tax=Helicobacter sp. NHP22-001 TaxID=3040202 RepID=UPI00255646F9|nr:hypothetical protein [Helicobacter sp. NHP22-001]
MVRHLALILSFSLGTLCAHPFSAFNGPFVAVGMGVGRGYVLQNGDFTGTSSNLSSHSTQFGFQLQGGDQKYFNPFVGVSYYGYFGYRYLYMDQFAHAFENAASANRYSLGVGANLLINIYSKFKRKGRRLKVYNYGVFGGLLAIANIWSVRFSGMSASYVRNNANIDAVFGVSMRFDKFKLTFGVHVPLANQTRLVRVPSSSPVRSLEIGNNYQSSELFMNFIRIF